MRRNIYTKNKSLALLKLLTPDGLTYNKEHVVDDVYSLSVDVVPSYPQMNLLNSVISAMEVFPPTSLDVSLDAQVAVYLGQIDFSKDPIISDIESRVNKSTLLYYGKSSNMGYIISGLVGFENPGVIEEYDHSDINRLRMCVLPSETEIIEYPSGNMAIFADGRLGYKYSYLLLTCITVMSHQDTFGAYADKDINESKFIDVVNIIDRRLAKNIKYFGDYISLTTELYTSNELRDLFVKGALTFDIGHTDRLSAHYALYLLCESTDYLYQMEIIESKVVVYSVTRDKLLRMYDRYNEILVEIFKLRLRYILIETIEDTIALVWQYKYKAFVMDGSYYIAVEYDSKELISNQSLHREYLLREIEKCSLNLTNEEILSMSNLRLANTYIYHNVESKDSASKVVCYFPPLGIDEMPQEENKTPEERHHSDSIMWLYFVVLGYRVPRENIRDINVKDNLMKIETPLRTIYSYACESGFVFNVGEGKSDDDYEWYNQQYKKGNLFNSVTFNIYIETGKILTSPPRVIRRMS